MKMRKIQTAIGLSVALLIGVICSAQETKRSGGFAVVGTSVLIDKEFTNKAALNAGIGVFVGEYFSVGANFDMFIFKDPKFVNAKGDFRIYPLSNAKEVMPVVILQPGYVLYSQNNVKGTASIDLLLGVMAKPVKKKGIGVSLAAGYSKFGFKTNGVAAYNDAIKVQAGILF